MGFQCTTTSISKGKFWSGFAAGSLSSLAASAWSGGTSIDANGNSIAGTGMKGLGGDFASSTAGMVAFGTVMGGASAKLSGGNFWQGAATGLTVSLLNHTFHKTDSKNGIDPPKKESTKDFVKRYLAGQKKDFFGADVDLWSYNGTSNSTLFGTIHTSEVHFYNYLNKGFQIQPNGFLHPSTMLLMHEYGHFLHAQYAPTNFYSYAMWSSAATANFSSAGTNWTEITANTYSYYYFGQPKGWNFVEYPVNSNYLNLKTIQSLQNHK